MANLEFYMEEKRYNTAAKERRTKIISFPEFPLRETQVLPDSSSAVSASPKANLMAGTKSRSALTNPHLIWYAAPNGRVKSVFLQEDGSEVIKYGTAFVFATNWAATAATNIYQPETDKFADSITYYPALGGNIDNPPFPPVLVTDAAIHFTMVSNTDSEPLYNIAFLHLDKNAEKPDSYCGLRYQYNTYNKEGILVVGYPNELPADGTAEEKGTYMYRGMGNVTSTDVFTNHDATTSDGYAGAPLYMNWADGNGYVAVAMNAYENGSTSAAIKLNRLIFGAMRQIREESEWAYCDRSDYQNVANHRLELKNDGYYECSVCGYRAIAPELQDQAILSTDDYLKVLATTAIYAFIINDDSKNILLYRLREEAHKVRSSDAYTGLYEYQDGSGKCPIIQPEQWYDGDPVDCVLVGPVEVNSANILYYNGILHNIANTILGLTAFGQLHLDISEVIAELMQTGDVTMSMYEVVKKLAEKAGNKAVELLLDLIQLGVDVKKDEDERGIQVGDKVVTFTANRGTFGQTFLVVFNTDNQLRKIIYQQ